MTTTLKEHPIWHSVFQTLEQINPDQIANDHLQACQDEISGYWDENDQFYKTICFTQRPIPKLISRSLGLTSQELGNVNWLQLKYALTIPTSGDSPNLHPSSMTAIGELSLILDENLEIFDENWLIDLKSPCVLAIQ